MQKARLTAREIAFFAAEQPQIDAIRNNSDRSLDIFLDKILFNELARRNNNLAFLIEPVRELVQKLTAQRRGFLARDLRQFRGDLFLAAKALN